jgi:hypothetical protein
MMPLEPLDQQHLKAAHGYIELGMFLEANEELESIDPFCWALPEVLDARLGIYQGAHHLPRILDQVEFFHGLCREEIEHYGEYRYHGFLPDEVVDFIQDDLCELGDGICRMIRDTASI